MDRVWLFGCGLFVCLTSACSSDDTTNPASGGSGTDPDTAPQAMVDRFSDSAGHLQKRSDSPSLPGANEAVDFDQGPFITQGLGPDGEIVKYYNFDVQTTTPAPIYVPMKGGVPVPEQLNIVGVIPGDAGYNDFWQVVAVTVPDSYVANTLTSADAVTASGYAMQTTDMLVNCPIVPDGSTATLRDTGDTSGTGLSRGWYGGEVVHYFTFGEKAGGLKAENGQVPTSPIWVTFNDDSKGPASGFETEPGSVQTHNVTGSLPSGSDYSPLWDVTPYPDAHFDDVSDATTAIAAAGDGAVAATVNCPIVSEQAK
ncbi:MAG TPA: hypothetical protein VMI54_19985 [Polyangiaceae bacterium]|nr:hypothetical protein [Polyangiaceae bacterium]